MKIKDEDRVLIRVRNKEYLVKAGSSVLHTHAGSFDLSLIVGKNYGEAIISSSGEKGYLFQPTPFDFMMKVKRLTQIVYPKDASYILMRLGVKPGDRVIEAGTGSGAFTIVLASAVGEGGRIYSYDERDEFLNLARDNIKRAGLEGRVEFKKRKVEEGFDETDVDAVFLDLPSPWIALEPAWRSLKGGGLIGSLSPTFNQVEKTVVAMESANFEVLESVEILLRQILAREGKTRPRERMVSHTGFLTFARKIYP